MTDPELREIVVGKFLREFREKFDRGTIEHNADGARGLYRMRPEQLLQACLEEVFDLAAYLTALEIKVAEQAQELTQLRNELSAAAAAREMTTTN